MEYYISSTLDRDSYRIDCETGPGDWHTVRSGLSLDGARRRIRELARSGEDVSDPEGLRFDVLDVHMGPSRR